MLRYDNRLKLGHFRVYQIWHFKLSTATVTQTGHISLSYAALRVLLVHHSYGLFLPSLHGGKKKKNQWRFSVEFPFQYFVSCGVFISWVVANKAHLIETSIYYLKVLVREKRKKKKKRLHFFTGSFTASHPQRRRSHKLPEMKYDLVFSMHFQSSKFSGISFLWR